MRRLVVLVAAAAFVVGMASAASAHAIVTGTSPKAGSVLASAPAQVTLHFDEHIEVTPGAIHVFDDQLRRVDRADASHLTGRSDTVGVHLTPDLPTGTYTVAFRVISDDSHPGA